MLGMSLVLHSQQEWHAHKLALLQHALRAAFETRTRRLIFTQTGVEVVAAMRPVEGAIAASSQDGGAGSNFSTKRWDTQPLTREEVQIALVQMRLIHLATRWEFV